MSAQLIHALVTKLPSAWILTEVFLVAVFRATPGMGSFVGTSTSVTPSSRALQWQDARISPELLIVSAMQVTRVMELHAQISMSVRPVRTTVLETLSVPTPRVPSPALVAPDLRAMESIATASLRLQHPDRPPSLQQSLHRTPPLVPPKLRLPHRKHRAAPRNLPFRSVRRLLDHRSSLPEVCCHRSLLSHLLILPNLSYLRSLPSRANLLLINQSYVLYCLE
mmetsp:Transcript_8675/g.12598  ORF Transcript_8675/g.12598 Transcript_8675/m.12598 type:complete len:223 (+) Transcript_8675:780-1448(+)